MKSWRLDSLAILIDSFMSPAASRESLHPRLPVIAPSMLKCDFGNLHREVERLEAAGAQTLHFDVMDGHFVPNLSYGAVVIERLRPLTNLLFDVHLMIAEPARYLDDYIAAGCNWITFHIEATPEPAPLLRRIRQAGCLAGVALNPPTPVAAVEAAIPDCDLVLVMSVEPGFGGQSFIPACADKAREVRRLGGSELLLSMDGGLGPATIAAAADAGTDVYVAGSSIFDQPDYHRAIAEMAELARRHRR